MPQITIKKGGPANDIEDGVYPVILTDMTGPKTIYPPNAPEGTNIYDWTFVIDDEAGTTEIQDSTSTASGPKSKMYGWLTALLGGKAPAPDTTFDSATLLGRRALATIGHNENGWPKITQLTAMPASMLAAGVAKATGAPLKGLPKVTTTPARAAVAAATEAAGDDLPF